MIEQADIRQPRQQGVGLIEVLVAVAVLSIGLLGIGALQGVSMRNNNNAYFRTQATVMAGTIIDEIRANRQEIMLRGGWRADQFDTWEAEVQRIFPNGELLLVNSADGAWSCAPEPAICETLKVRIRWTDEVQTGNSQDEAAAGGYDTTDADLSWFDLESRI